jgi:hypothetical protein
MGCLGLDGLLTDADELGRTVAFRKGHGREALEYLKQRFNA